MENFDKLKILIQTLEPDIKKIEKRFVKEASIRARKRLQDIKKICKILRQDIQDTLYNEEVRRIDEHEN